MALLIIPKNASAASPTTAATCAFAGGKWTAGVVRPPLLAAAGTCTISGSYAENLTAEQQAQSFMYYRILGSCIASATGGSHFKNGGGNDAGDRITQSAVKSGEWFGAGSVRGGSYLDAVDNITVRIDTNDTNCDQSALVNGALKIWKNWAPDEALCAMGFRRASDAEFNASRCTDAQGGSDEFKPAGDENYMVGKFKSAVLDRMYGGKDPVLSDAVNYLIYLKTFEKVCAPKAVISQKAPAGITTRDYKVRVIQTDYKSAIDTYYTGISNKEQTEGAGIYQQNFGQNIIDTMAGGTCGDLVAAINGKNNNGFADNYVLSVTQGTTTAPVSPICASGDPKCTTPASTTGATTCGIDGIGWLVCPALSFMGTLLQDAFKGLADNFLVTDTALFSTTSGTYSAWSVFRNFANVAFVIVFLIIIFSQLTGLGVSNYGVKKMLPRIVIAAILVNISYFVCQLAVDLSNILGYSIKTVLDSILTGANVTPSADGSANGWGIVSIVGAALVTGVVGYFALGVLIPILLGALVAVLMIVLLLIARKALIVLLIVLSPLAFVAFLLPNTESLFNKWRKLFVSLLLLFPIISVVFGLSSLASKILLGAGPGSSQEIIMQIIAVGVASLPFFAVPVLLKSALDGVGNVGAKINGFGAKMGGNLGKAGGKSFSNSRLGQFQDYRKNERSLRRAQIQSGTFRGRRLDPRNILSSANRKINESNVSGKFGDRALATGAALSDKEDAELMSNAGSRLDNTSYNGVPLSQAQMMQIATGHDVTDASGAVVAKNSSFDTHTRKAAIQRAARVANVKDAHDLVDASGALNSAGENIMSTSERKILSSSLAGSSAVAKAPYLGGKTLGEIEQGTATVRKASLGALKDGKISAEALAGGDKNTVNELVNAARSTAVGSDERLALQAAYAQLNLPASRLREKIVAGGEHDIALSGIGSL